MKQILMAAAFIAIFVAVPQGDAFAANFPNSGVCPPKDGVRTCSAAGTAWAQDLKNCKKSNCPGYVPQVKDKK